VPYGREARRRRQLLTPKLPAPGSWLLAPDLQSYADVQLNVRRAPG
jgi:hypothetical protein